MVGEQHNLSIPSYFVDIAWWLLSAAIDGILQSMLQNVITTLPSHDTSTEYLTDVAPLDAQILYGNHLLSHCTSGHSGCAANVFMVSKVPRSSQHSGCPQHGPRSSYVGKVQRGVPKSPSLRLGGEGGETESPSL